MPNQGQMNYGMGANMMAMNGSMNGYPMPAPGQVPRMMGMQVPMSPMQGMPGPYPVMQQPLGGSPQQASPQQTQQMASQMASQQAAAALQMQQIQMAHAVQAQAQTHAVCRQIDYYFSEEVRGVIRRAAAHPSERGPTAFNPHLLSRFSRPTPHPSPPPHPRTHRLDAESVSRQVPQVEDGPGRLCSVERDCSIQPD